MKQKRNLQTGDLVLLKGKIHDRLDWPLGLAVATHPGQNQNVRSVTIKIGDSEYKRPITSVVRLELDVTDRHHYVDNEVIQR